jgi:fatty-acyl-CoA synthase
VKAIELKLQEVFAAAAPGVPLRVTVKEQGGGFAAEAVVDAAADRALETRLRDALGAIAVATTFRFSS